MKIAIPDDYVQALLAGLRRVKTNGAARWVVSAIEKELQDKADVDRAIQAGDINETLDPTLLTPKVTASCHSDDYRVEVESFDATTWFATADDEAITRLREKGYGQSYMADTVAEEAAEYDERVAALFTYLETVNGGRRGGDPIGFECYVDEDEAEAWVAAHRPHLIEQWKKEE